MSVPDERMTVVEYVEYIRTGKRGTKFLPGKEAYAEATRILVAEGTLDVGHLHGLPPLPSPGADVPHGLVSGAGSSAAGVDGTEIAVEPATVGHHEPVGERQGGQPAPLTSQPSPAADQDWQTLLADTRAEYEDEDDRDDIILGIALLRSELARLRVRAQQHEEALRRADALLTTVEGGNIPRGEAVKLHVRAIVRSVLRDEPATFFPDRSVVRAALGTERDG